MNRGLLAPVLPFGSMFRSSVGKVPFAATKSIRFNNGLHIKAIATAAAPLPNTQFVVQKSMPMDYAFSQGRFMWFYAMLQNLKYAAGLTKAPFLYTGYVSDVNGQPHGFGMKSSSHKYRIYQLYEEGEWRDGKLCGPAVRMHWFMGFWIESVAGLFVDGKPSKCRTVNYNGVIFEGVFEGNDVKNGFFFTPEGVLKGRVEGSLQLTNFYEKYQATLPKCCPEVPVRTPRKKVTSYSVSILQPSFSLLPR
jgi:hypothetical protein